MSHKVSKNEMVMHKVVYEITNEGVLSVLVETHTVTSTFRYFVYVGPTIHYTGRADSIAEAVDKAYAFIKRTDTIERVAA